MPSPFPGMNPYLEEPALWAGIHHWLITEIARSLNPLVNPNYFVAIEERVYETIDDSPVLIGVPDNSIAHSARVSSESPVAVLEPQVAIQADRQSLSQSASQPLSVTVPLRTTVREGYLEIRRFGSEAVVTVIEVLSPKNKRSREGRAQYENKRAQILGSRTHLVEIDLLRQGEPMPLVGSVERSHYRILVSRSDRRPQADLYIFNLSDPIPQLPIPLEGDDPTPILDLKHMLETIYDQGSYTLRLNYQQLPNLLTWEEKEWVRQIIESQV